MTKTPAYLSTTEFQYTYLTMETKAQRGKWFTQGHKVNLYRARMPLICNDTKGNRDWGDDLVRWTKENSQPQWVSLFPLNTFPPQIAGSWLVLLEWPRKGAQEAAGGQWMDHRLEVRRPEFKFWPWQLKDDPGHPTSLSLITFTHL